MNIYRYNNGRIIGLIEEAFAHSINARWKNNQPMSFYNAIYSL